ncbi:type IV toxin-antitoxin system AbiEi family antitoxin domain-containing protein [Blastococcus tunisiensis]|uniref:Transcriptional regulator, AbiEi antitoxin, Type IV TA system n=1 Tax=Blastococcus tunisiensis TaxID=1798228 RepID=A0A1I2JQP8_9ACTN|nr:type IV toxin-antitoxin system AbiEi family antitoxin domain-containing protein [Blastococcus sp. DSM 46838]SFF56283.1 Transcriptional regulator, AbiEi antitoxin, Type IV TA system [Blastococcus sp. DSM 46838]
MHPLLRAAADRQCGLVTATDAYRAGYQVEEVRRLCSSGQWKRLRRGIYVPADTLADVEAAGRRYQLDCLAVLLSTDRRSTALSHTSAARLSGLHVDRRSGGDIRLTDPHHNRAGRGFRVTRSPLEADEISTLGSFRLTTPARTLVDGAREWPLEDAVVAIDAALLKGRTTRDSLTSAVARARLWPGGRRAERALTLADGRAESPLETRGRLRLIGAGLAPDDLQVEIRVDGRLVAVADAWYEAAAVAIEFDGRIKYTDPWRGRSPEQVLWEEKRREDDVRALDIGVARIVDADVGSRWPATEAHLRRLLGRAGPTNRRFTATPRERGVHRTG